MGIRTTYIRTILGQLSETVRNHSAVSTLPHITSMMHTHRVLIVFWSS